MSFHYALLSCTLRYSTSLHFQESALYHSPLVMMCISGSFFFSADTTGSADEDFLRLCPIYILISCKTKIHLRIVAFLEVYDNHRQHYIRAVQRARMKRESLREEIDEKETKTVHEEVTRNGGIMDSGMLSKMDGNKNLPALRKAEEMSSFCC